LHACDSKAACAARAVWGFAFVLAAARWWFLLRKRFGFGFGLLVLCAGIRDAMFAARAFVLCVCLCAGIRDTVFAAQAFVLCVCLCAGIRAMSSCFMRRPCAGRHLLFFAAAKKSRGGFKG
jgi:hypothetical protein